LDFHIQEYETKFPIITPSITSEFKTTFLLLMDSNNFANLIVTR